MGFHGDLSMQLRYFVPFKAQEGLSADVALQEKLVNIEGIAIDASVNANKWQVPEQDLQFVADGLQGAQLRVDHAESALMVVGKVTAANRDGQRVMFRAEVGEERLIEKILRGYVSHVSIQVDSDEVECSKCHKPTRQDGMLVHLCPDAWEIIHKPKVRELSVVASPAYKDTAFVPVGFAAAMDKSQTDGRRLELLSHVAVLKAKLSLLSRFERVLQSFVIEKTGDDEGSNREVQEPDKQILIANEVKPLSEHNAQQGASSQQAQGVTNTAPGEKKPTQVTYDDFMKQLQDLEKQINDSGASAADVDALKQKVADLEAEVAKRATKKSLSKKISDLQKQLQDQDDDGSQAEGAEAEADAAEAAKRRAGKGIVAVDQLQTDALGDYKWFNDLLKAHKKLVGFQ
jgi:hypothetical protein